MSLVADSPVHSSSTSGDDYAAFLELELDSDSDTSPKLEGEVEEAEGKEEQDDNLEHERNKRRKVEILENSLDLQSSTSVEVEAQTSGTSSERDICEHPAVWNKLCVRCGQKTDDVSGVAFGYIHKNLRLSNEELARLREKDLKILLSQEKLYLVLDLDHTLLNSSLLDDINGEEAYLKDPKEGLPDTVKNSLHRLDKMRMMTKLRPFVHSFLEEASKLFEMYIYTMGDRNYALEMANLLDPKGIYFNSRVIANVNSTKRYQKGLDVVLGEESAVLILDDTEKVWEDHLENLILMDRYHFFASSLRQFNFPLQQSLSERKSDESEADGALATILRVLQKIHSKFFDSEQRESLENRDVRQVLGTVRKEVLKGCKIVFSRVFPRESLAENQHYWKLAEQLGATFTKELDPSVTHVVSVDAGTEKSHWAVQEKKFLVNPRWIDSTRYLWQKQPEENYPVRQLRNV